MSNKKSNGTKGKGTNGVRHTGRVLNYDVDRGRGSIDPDEGTLRIMFDDQALRRMGVSTIRGRQRVSYSQTTMYGNLMAINLELLASEADSKSEKAELGTVKWFHFQKGIGFITPDRGGVDIFVNGPNLANSGLVSLREGQRVRYTPTPGRPKPIATKISIVD